MTSPWSGTAWGTAWGPLGTAWGKNGTAWGGDRLATPYTHRGSAVPCPFYGYAVPGVEKSGGSGPGRALR
jgi:hypothetical protein